MKKLSVLLVLAFALLFTTTSVFAIKENENCNPFDLNTAPTSHGCDAGLTCVPKPGAKKVTNEVGSCQSGGSIQVTKPAQGFASLGNAISNILTLAFAVGVLIVLVMLILGAYEWMTSGGDKEAVGKARTRIINALLGLAVLAIAYALANVFGQFVGLDLKNLTIPAPDPNAVGL